MTTINRSDFDSQTRQALQNLHDFAVLQKLPLTNMLGAPTGTLDQGVRKLRAEILDAIEHLNPPGNMPSRARERRPYALLYGHCVQGMSSAELADELAISIRQLRREYSRAVEAVLDLLWDRLNPQLQAGSESILPRTADTDTDQLLSQAHIDDISVNDLMDGIFATLAPLAASRGMKLENQLPANLPLVRANRVVLRQGILGLISAALQRFADGQILLALATSAVFQLCVQAEGKPQPGTSAKAGLDVSRKLIAGLGGEVEINASEDRWRADISLPRAEEIPILAMDDNIGLIELYRRYVAGRGYRIFDAHNADEIIALAQKHNPKLIILDVMMPDQDGWEVLQRLESVAPTQNIPIMICSVLDETEIAFTLGASDYLSKPVTQDALLAKVERWCRKT